VDEGVPVAELHALTDVYKKFIESFCS